jgi:hypothetical protein
MTMEEKHSYRLIRDLFAHKDAIFGELKRASSLSHSGSVNESRARAISTDESNRKANMEARTRAILAAGGGSRSRATSPAPGPRGHRRDRSSGGPETRFPIQPSPVSPADLKKSRDSVGNSARYSLEIPGSNEGSPVVDASAAAPPLQTVINGSGEHAATFSPGGVDGMGDEVGVEKRNSLGRSGHVGPSRMTQARKVVGGGLGRSSSGKHESTENRPMGVSLIDRPMDD